MRRVVRIRKGWEEEQTNHNNILVNLTLSQFLTGAKQFNVEPALFVLNPFVGGFESPYQALYLSTQGFFTTVYNSLSVVHWIFVFDGSLTFANYNVSSFNFFDCYAVNGNKSLKRITTFFFFFFFEM
jgi:hypothetical protein